MPIPTDMIVRVAHADIVLQWAFSRSIAYWQRKSEFEDAWEVLTGDGSAVLVGKTGGVVIDGRCSNGAAAPDGGTLHVYGDLVSKIVVGGHHEIVVTGDVGPDGFIEASGFSSVFVGGRFSGRLRSSGPAKVWIETDFDGSIETGTPLTEIHVGHDYSGDIAPVETAAILRLSVAGFAPHASMCKIVDRGYTEFHASVARSDVEPGLYPLAGCGKRTPSHNRWCVQTRSAT